MPNSRAYRVTRTNFPNEVLHESSRRFSMGFNYMLKWTRNKMVIGGRVPNLNCFFTQTPYNFRNLYSGANFRISMYRESSSVFQLCIPFFISQLLFRMWLTKVFHAITENWRCYSELRGPVENRHMLFLKEKLFS